MLGASDCQLERRERKARVERREAKGCKKPDPLLPFKNCAKTPISLSRVASSQPGARVRTSSPKGGHQRSLRFLGVV
jgi:hypothetical protein